MGDLRDSCIRKLLLGRCSLGFGHLHPEPSGAAPEALFTVRLQPDATSISLGGGPGPPLQGSGAFPQLPRIEVEAPTALACSRPAMGRKLGYHVA